MKSKGLSKPLCRLTSAFAKALKEKGESPEGLIGQFGVGFYSAFMVAETVVVESLSALPDAAAIRWCEFGLAGSPEPHLPDGEND